MIFQHVSVDLIKYISKYAFCLTFGDVLDLAESSFNLKR